MVSPQKHLVLGGLLLQLSKCRSEQLIFLVEKIQLKFHINAKIVLSLSAFALGNCKGIAGVILAFTGFTFS